MDYREFRNRLEKARQDSSMGGFDKFCEIVAEYTEACKTVNQLLDQCNLLLLNGLRSDALRLSEQEHLLDAVNALDIWSPNEWISIAEQYQIEPPPPLDTEIAMDLNEAWIQEMPQMELLARYRFLSLARAPLATRVQVMRRIASLEPDGELATKDLPLFERELLRQILAKMWEADQRDDIAEFMKWYQYSTAETWCVELTATDQERMRRTYEKYRARIFNSELARLEQELNDAFSELDVQKGRTLRKQWNDTIDQGNGLEDPAILSRANPAMEWLRQADQNDEILRRFQQVAYRLQNAIDQENIDFDELERLYRNACSFRIPLDNYLLRRYQQRIDAFSLAQRKQRRNRVLLVVAALTLLAGGISFAAVQHSKSRQIDECIKRVNDLIGRYQFDEAQIRYEQFAKKHPLWLQNEDILRLTEELQQKTIENRQRLERLQHAMDEFRKTPTQGLAKQIDELVRTDGEKHDVALLKNEVHQSRQQQQKKTDEAFALSHKTIKERIDALELEKTSIAEIRQVEQELSELEGNLDEISESLRDTSETGLILLRKQLDRIRDKTIKTK